MLKNMNKTLVTMLAPYKPLMDKIGMQIHEYEEHDDRGMFVIIGIKVSFLNPEVYKKFIGEK